MSDPIASVAIVGGGITAWSAAAAFKRRIPSLHVQLIATAPSFDSLADRIISTLPSIRGFHQDLGLTEADTVGKAGSSYRLGTVLEHWAEGLPAYVHAYGDYGAQVGTLPFHQLWLRQRARSGIDPFDRYSPAAELARSGRAPLPSGSIGHVIAHAEPGLQLTLDSYRSLLHAFATHVGVDVRTGSVANVRLRSTDGFIDAIGLEDGGSVAADLFVDCTGPEARIFSEIDASFDDWSRWLPCDRVQMWSGPPDGEVVVADHVAAFEWGWQWKASSPHRSSSGITYSSAHAREGDVARATDENAAAVSIAMHQGRRPAFWVRNCVAIGDAAVRLEPLEWTNLHLVHSQIDRVIAMMPGRDCAPVELAEFNRQCADEADRVRDFICLHYACSRRKEPFWKDAAAIEPPPSLAHTLALFAERGRLPFYEEETFSKDSWLAVLLGQGVWPRREDPLVDQIPEANAAHLLASIRNSARTFAGASPAALDQR
jgi:tryptophan halogenase